MLEKLLYGFSGDRQFSECYFSCKVRCCSAALCSTFLATVLLSPAFCRDSRDVDAVRAGSARGKQWRTV